MDTTSTVPVVSEETTVSGQHPLGRGTGEQEQVMDMTKTCFVPAQKVAGRSSYISIALLRHTLRVENAI